MLQREDDLMSAGARFISLRKTRLIKTSRDDIRALGPFFFHPLHFFFVH